MINTSTKADKARVKTPSCSDSARTQFFDGRFPNPGNSSLLFLPSRSCSEAKPLIMNRHTTKKLAYLESTNPANLSLYQRHGFEFIGNIQAGTSPPLFPMIREPR